MKVGHVISFFLFFVIVIGSSPSQQTAARSERGSTSAIVPGQGQPALTLAQIDPAIIAITETGFDPAVITVTVGTTVTWRNDTTTTHTLQSGLQAQPSDLTIYLPLIMKGENGSSRSMTESAPVLTSSESFSATLAPNETFSQSFASEGETPFYLTTAPQFTGRVIVQPGAAPSVGLSANPTKGVRVPYRQLYCQRHRHTG